MKTFAEFINEQKLNEDAWDMSGPIRDLAFKRLAWSKEHKPKTISSYLDLEAMRYSYKDGKDQKWLAQGSIVVSGGKYYVYLGMIEPKKMPVPQITHHIYDETGKRVKWNQGINAPIDVIPSSLFPKL